MRSESLATHFDWPTVVLYIVLVLMGWLNIFAAGYDESIRQSIFDLSTNAGRQLLFIGTSAVLIMVIMIVDNRFYETFAYVIYAAVILLCIVVIFAGSEVAGSRAWFRIGAFGVQPSEFAKFAVSLAVARFIGSIGFRMDRFNNQAILFAMIGFPMIVILGQNDTGTALVFAAFILVLFREGLSPFLLVVGMLSGLIFVLTLLVENHFYLYGGVLALLALAIAIGKKRPRRIAYLVIGGFLIMGVIKSVDFVINDVLKPHQQNRIKALVNPAADPLGYGWNVTQSKIAIGSGGLAGKGFLRGTQTKFDFVPKQSTDFIFCTIGEEHGWIGSLIVVTLFVMLLLRVITIAERQKNRFSRAYGYCVGCILFFHFAVNIGMTVGLFPVIGIPLPFFSYGGSSLWGFTILLFVLLKLDAHRMEVLQRL